MSVEYGPLTVGVNEFHTDLHSIIDCFEQTWGTDHAFIPIGYTDDEGFAGIIAYVDPVYASRFGAVDDLYKACTGAIAYLERTHREESELGIDASTLLELLETALKKAEQSIVEWPEYQPAPASV